MKKILSIFPLLATILFFGSCADDNEVTLPVPAVEEKSFAYSGDLQVGSFTLADAAVSVEINKSAAGYMDILMKGVKFSDKMPVTLDIALNGIPCTEADGRLVFAAENIVPLIAGKPSSDYTFALLTGWINADASAITFVAQMADDLAAHVAGMVFVYTAGKVENEGGGTVTPPSAGGVEYGFTGALQVGDFTLAPASLTVVVNMQASTVDVKMLGVKFSDRMPLVLDITLCSLPCTNVAGIMTFSGENVVPHISIGNPADYTFAKAEGEFDVRTSKLTFNARMADNLAAYVAGKEFVYNGVLNK